MACEAELFFLPGARGDRLCLLHRPAAGQSLRGTLVFVHPFAEELNKCRRCVSVTARALAEAGWASVQIDLFGCGDSAGDFGEATWQFWLDDIALAHGWAAQRFDAPVWLWGFRAGCLLVSDSLVRLSAPVDVLLWQPVLSGRQYLNQFLRLKLASQMLGNTADRSSTHALREQLRQGEALEIGGYSLSSQLAEGLERSELKLTGALRRLVWCEISSAQVPRVSPASQAKIVQLGAAGVRVESHATPGISVWQTVEISECPTLTQTTLQALAS